MICIQLKLYLTYLVAEILLSLLLLGNQRLKLGLRETIGQLVFIATIHYLCRYKYHMIGNILVGSVILLGILSNLSIIKI